MDGSIHQLLSDVWRQTHGELEDVYRDWLGTGPVEDDHRNDIVADGKSMSYICHDMVGFITKADLKRAAHDLPALARLYGDPQFDLADTWANFISPAGCDVWDVGLADKAQHRPVSSKIPTLVLAGEFDSAVPPLVARQVAAKLSNAHYYEFPAAPHIPAAARNPMSGHRPSTGRNRAERGSRHPAADPFGPRRPAAGWRRRPARPRDLLLFAPRAKVAAPAHCWRCADRRKR